MLFYNDTIAALIKMYYSGPQLRPIRNMFYPKKKNVKIQYCSLLDKAYTKGIYQAIAIELDLPIVPKYIKYKQVI